MTKKGDLSEFMNQNCCYSHWAGKTIQLMYVLRNIKARSYNHCCSGRAKKNVTYSECVCNFSSSACNAHAPHFHLWPARLYYIYSHCHIYKAIFEKKIFCA